MHEIHLYLRLTLVCSTYLCDEVNQCFYGARIQQRTSTLDFRVFRVCSLLKVSVSLYSVVCTLR